MTPNIKVMREVLEWCKNWPGRHDQCNSSKCFLAWCDDFNGGNRHKWSLDELAAKLDLSKEDAWYLYDVSRTLTEIEARINKLDVDARPSIGDRVRLTRTYVFEGTVEDVGASLLAVGNITNATQKTPYGDCVDLLPDNAPPKAGVKPTHIIEILEKAAPPIPEGALYLNDNTGALWRRTAIGWIEVRTGLKAENTGKPVKPHFRYIGMADGFEK